VVGIEAGRAGEDLLERALAQLKNSVIRIDVPSIVIRQFRNNRRDHAFPRSTPPSI
jgi:hypothetical protein